MRPRRTGGAAAGKPRPSPAAGARARPLAWAAVTVAAGLVAMAMIVRTLGGTEERASRERFEESARQSTLAIERELEGYFDELVDIGAFHAADPDASPEVFERFVSGTGIIDRLPALNGIVYLAVVPQERLEEFVEARRAVEPSFTRIALGATPPGRPHLILTHYVPGVDDLGLPRGADISPITSISDVIAAANRSGVGVTGSFQDDPLLQEVAADTDFRQIDLLIGTDFFVGMPVYADSGRQTTGAEPMGWVAAPVSDFDRVLAAATGDLPADLGASLTVELSGVDGVDRAALERVAQRTGDAGSLASARHRTTEDFTIEGVSWSLTLWSDESPDQTTAGVVVAGSLVAVALAGLLVYARLRSMDRERAYAAVLADREQFRRVVLDSVLEPMVVLDPSGAVLDANPAWDELVSARPEAGTPTEGSPDYLTVLAGLVAGDIGPLRAGLGRVVDDGSVEQVEVDLPLETAAGHRWYAIRISTLRAARGGAVVVHNDITERKRSEAELALRASHDDLTGLLNRQAMEDELERAWHRARQRESPLGVLFIDLDGFKPINDAHGHLVGDAVLRAVARRITGAVRSNDRTARLGGDEFLVLLGELEATDGAERTARRILEALEPPVAVGGLQLDVRASVGVAVVEQPANAAASSLIELADRAMYEAKRAGGDQYRLAR